MCKISKEEVQESFDKIRESELKEAIISPKLEEITGNREFIFNSAKHIIKQNVVYGTDPIFYKFNRVCEIYKRELLKENKETNRQLISDIDTICFLVARFCTDMNTGIFFIWLNEKEYKAIESYIKLNREERPEKITKIANEAIDQLQDNYETIKRSKSHEFFVERFCLFIVLMEIKAYVFEYVKQKSDNI